jgi:hypothetical protein
LGVPVYRIEGRNPPFLFIEDTPKEQQQAFAEFMAHQTCILVGDKLGIYPWDYKNFLYMLRDGKPLFWD